MTKFHFLKLSMILFCVALILGSCKDEDEPNDQPVFKIGAVIPLTGSAASTGVSTQAAIELAIADINNYLTDIGSGKSISVKIEDSETDTLVALQKVTELFGEGIMTMVGPYSSASVAAVKDYADQNGAIIISPSSVAISLAISDDNIFRMVPADFSQGEAMAALLEDDHISYIVPVVRDDLWGNELVETIIKHFLDNSGGMSSNVALYPANTSDFTEYILDLESRVQFALAQYDTAEIGIYMASFGEGTDILNSALENPTLKHLKWYGSSAYAQNESILLDTSAAAYASSHGLLCPIFGYDLAAKAKWEPLVNRIIDKIGRKPEIYALCAYDALWLITATYLSTGYPVDYKDFKTIFGRQANNYFGATGWTTINDAGDREFATYDFFKVATENEEYVWTIAARYNNATKELERY